MYIHTMYIRILLYIYKYAVCFIFIYIDFTPLEGIGWVQIAFYIIWQTDRVMCHHELPTPKVDVQLG